MVNWIELLTDGKRAERLSHDFHPLGGSGLRPWPMADLLGMVCCCCLQWLYGGSMLNIDIRPTKGLYYTNETHKYSQLY